MFLIATVAGASLFLSLLRFSLSIDESACWPDTNSCIRKNALGAWCYFPENDESSAQDCRGTYPEFQNILQTHLTQDLSIAYYCAANNTRLGGAGYTVSNDTKDVQLCASGRGTDNTLYTRCTNVTADNDFSGEFSCHVKGGPRRVRDGCYTLDTVPPTVTTGIPSSPTSFALPTVTFVLQDSNQPDMLKDVVIPLIVAFFGFCGSIVAAGVWRKRRSRKTQMDSEQAQVELYPIPHRRSTF